MIKIKYLFFLLLFSPFFRASGQELPPLKNVKLNKKAHFKATEALTQKVIAYLFETPIDKKNKSRNQAGQFLLNWMNGTPDYTFYLEEKETNFFNTDADLMLMYMASLTKFQLDHPNIKDQPKIVLGAMKILLPYLNTQDNKKSWSSSLWQLNDASQKGKLEEFLANTH